MRPQGEIRVDLAAALLDGDGTCKQLAQRTGWSIGLTRQTLDNMVRSGDASKPRTVRVSGVKRPVPVYSKADRATAKDSTHSCLANVLGGWVRGSSSAGGAAP